MTKRFLPFLFLSFCFSVVYAQRVAYNAAYKKPATASASTSTEIPSRAFDGDPTTNWCTPKFTGWIQVDLQNNVTVDSIKLFVNQYLSGSTVHEVKVSENMQDWTLVETLSGSTSNNQVITLPFTTPLSNIRGVMLNTLTSNSWVAWYEIEVYSTASKPTISQDGNVLTSSSATNNQWYLNGAPISGATSQTCTMSENGTYQVGVTYGKNSELLSEGVNFGVGVQGVEKYDVRIYPNPVTDRVSVEGVSSGLLELINLQGQVLRQVRVSGQNPGLDVSSLAAGVYSLRITSDEGMVVKKLLKK